MLWVLWTASKTPLGSFVSVALSNNCYFFLCSTCIDWTKWNIASEITMGRNYDPMLLKHQVANSRSGKVSQGFLFFLFVWICIHLWVSLMLGCQCARNSPSRIQSSLCRCRSWRNCRQVGSDPITGSSWRYILGDRFHSTTNPHKSPLCSFHDIILCLQANALKTSYQEVENNRKNKKRLQSAGVQGFGTHFLYNFLMDFYKNEMIIHKQLLNLKKRLPEGFQVKRDKYVRFIIIWTCRAVK